MQPERNNWFKVEQLGSYLPNAAKKQNEIETRSAIALGSGPSVPSSCPRRTSVRLVSRLFQVIRMASSVTCEKVEQLSAQCQQQLEKISFGCVFSRKLQLVGVLCGRLRPVLWRREPRGLRAHRRCRPARARRTVRPTRFRPGWPAGERTGRGPPRSPPPRLCCRPAWGNPCRS